MKGKNITRALSIFTILFLTGIVLGFTGCEQPGSEPSPSLKYYVYEGQISGGTRNIVVTVYENGTWNITDNGLKTCQGIYTGNPDSDGNLDIKITYEIQDGSGVMKPYDPPKDLTAIISENGTKMSFTYASEPLVAIRK